MTKAILSHLAEIRNGTVFKSASEGVPFVQGRHLKDGCLRPVDLATGLPPIRSFEDARLRAGDVLVDTRGGVNRAAVVPAFDGAAFAVLDLAIVRLGAEALTPEYLAMFLNLPSTQSKLSVRRSTATIPRLGLGALGALEIPLPSLARQKAMVALHEERQLQNKLTEKLSEVRNCLTDEILRQVAEGALMPDCRPT